MYQKSLGVVPRFILLWEKYAPLKMSQKAGRLGPGGPGEQGSELHGAPAPETAGFPGRPTGLCPSQIRPGLDWGRFVNAPLPQHPMAGHHPRREGGGCSEFRPACPRPGRRERRPGSPLPSTPHAQRPLRPPCLIRFPGSGEHRPVAAQQAPSHFLPLAPSISPTPLPGVRRPRYSHSGQCIKMPI